MLNTYWSNTTSIARFVLFILSFVAMTAQAQNISVIGQAKSDSPFPSATGQLTVQLANTVPAGTNVVWTKISDPPQTITTTSSDPVSRAAALPSYTPTSSRGFKISACLPGASSSTDSTNCAFFRFIGCANATSFFPNNPSNVIAGNVQNVSFRFQEESVFVNGVSEPGEFVGGIVVNWGNPSNGGTVNPTTSTSNTTGISQTAYMASTSVGTESLTGVAPVSSRLCFSRERTFNFNIQAAANTAPTVAVELPAANVPVSAGANLAIRARATDADGTIASVTVKATNTATGIVAFNETKNAATTAPNGYDFSWNNLPVGIYTLEASAIDNLGLASALPAPSRTITVTAINNIAPTASIERPATDVSAAVGQTLPIRVRANDSGGTVASVTVKATNTVSGAIAFNETKNAPTTAPDSYSFSWVNVPVGKYSITATATDNNGLSSAISPARIVTATEGVVSGVVNVLSPTDNSFSEVNKDVAIVARVTTPAGNNATSVIATITPANGSATITLPLRVSAASNRTFEATWKPITTGLYRISVTVTFNSGPTSTDAVRIDVRPAPIKAASLTITNENAIVIKPGRPVAFEVLAKDAQGNVAPGQLLEWTLAVKSATAKAGSGSNTRSGKQKAAGDTPDSVTAGSPTTDINGIARIAFTAGSAVEDRTFSVFLSADRSVEKTVIFKGAASATPPLTSMVVVGKSIIARPNETSEVTVVALGDNKAPIEGVPLDWFLEPADSGELSVINDTTNVAGESKASFRLLPTAKGVLLKACPRSLGSSSDKCARFVLKNALTELTQPAQTLAKPVVTQSMATSRLQLSQLRTRFQQLRNEQSGGYSNSVGVTVEGGRIPLPSPGRGESGSSTSSGDNSSSGSSSSSSSSSGGGSTERDISSDGVKGSRWGVFTMGDIDVSRSKNTIGAAQNDILKSGNADALQNGSLELSTQGLMIGVDYRLRPSAVIGVALGGLRGKATGDSASEQRARGVSGAVFAQWFIPGQFYVNTVANYGTNTYDLSRFATPEIRIDSNTKSKQTALQIEAGYNYVRDNLSVSPYLRAEHVRAAIDGINEPIKFADAIKTSNSTLRANTIALGLQADAKFSTRNGVWIPGLRVEYLSEKQKQSLATAELVNAVLINGTPLVTSIPVDPYDSTYGNVGVSLQWLTGIGAQPISLFFGYDTTFGKSGVSTKRFSAGVKIPL
jgi:Autotransporter beta-domain/Bacterial Ig domain